MDDTRINTKKSEKKVKKVEESSTGKKKKTEEKESFEKAWESRTHGGNEA